MKVKKYILIAEDSQTQAEMLSQILQKEGYRVGHEPDGHSALDHIGTKRPDCIISDVIMPGMNGYELCRSIKANKQYAQIPVLLLTTLTDAEDILIGLECGADNYLMKPYDENILLNRVERMLRDPVAPDTVIESQDCQIIYDGKQYRLSAARSGLLNMLISIYEAATQKTRQLQEKQNSLNRLNVSLEKLVNERTADLIEKIRERKAMEESVRLSEQKYRGIVENALLGVFITDRDGEIGFANSALANMLGFDSAAALTGKKITDFLKEEKVWSELTDLLINEHQVLNHELVLSGKDNSSSIAELNLLSREEHLFGVLFDITARKSIEEKDRKYREKLRIAKEHAEESDKQMSAFLSNILHEVKTPMNTIIGFSSLLGDTEHTGAQGREYRNHIEHNTKVLGGLINNILELARLEASKIQLSVTRFGVNEFMDGLSAEYIPRENAIAGGMVSVELVKGSPETEIMVRTDEKRLKQVFQNLFDNAARYTREGSIHLGYELEKDHVQFFVKDSGSGIQDEYQDKVFERFWRGENAQNVQGSGLGIGLTIAKQLVEMMNGKITFQSVPGQGTKVCFSIPVTELAGKSEAGPADIDTGLSDDFSAHHILVVEDNTMNYTLLKAYLDRTGVKLSWAKDGRESLEMLAEHSGVDLVLMDLHMPNMDGFEATKAIRKSNPELPVIAVTAYSLEEERKKARQEGFTDFLTKPVSQDTLIKSISSVLRDLKIASDT
jgi:PAS domain S-box-containing protein